MRKKHFNKKLVLTKEDDGDFENSTKCWIGDNVNVDDDVKVRQHCHITGKYIGSGHRDCNINVKLNHKIPIVFHNVKNYDSQFFMQELGKFNRKVNVIPNRAEKYMSFNISKNDFTYLIQEFNSKVLDFVRQKGFDPYEHMADFEKFNEELLNKEKSYSSLTGKK